MCILAVLSFWGGNGDEGAARARFELDGVDWTYLLDLEYRFNRRDNFFEIVHLYFETQI